MNIIYVYDANNYITIAPFMQALTIKMEGTYVQNKAEQVHI